MGTGHSKNSPDEQMRSKMENGFDEDDDDDGLEVPPEREKNINPRSKSNVSNHNGERFQNSSADGDEYFNRIYNKSSEKSLQSSLSVGGGGSFGVKSAPPRPKKEKDPEVDAAIAELEETFKVLGGEVPVLPPQLLLLTESPSSKVMGNGGKGGSEFDNHEEELDNGYSDSLSIGGEDVPLTPPSSQTTEVMSDESGLDLRSLEGSPYQQIQYSRQLVSRAGPGPGTGKLLEMNGSRGIPGTSGGFSRSNMFSSCGSSMTTSSRGLLVSSHNINKNGRNSSNMLSQSVLMQQRQDFQQRKLVTEQQLRTETIDENGAEKIKVEDWTYEPVSIFFKC